MFYIDARAELCVVGFAFPQSKNTTSFKWRFLVCFVYHTHDILKDKSQKMWLRRLRLDLGKKPSSRRVMQNHFPENLHLWKFSRLTESRAFWASSSHGPAWTEGLAQMTSRHPIQPKTFCDSEKKPWLIWPGVGQSLVLGWRFRQMRSTSRDHFSTNIAMILQYWVGTYSKIVIKYLEILVIISII